MTVGLRGMGAMVQNTDGTFSVTVDPNAGNINLAPANVLNPMASGDPVADRYVAQLSQAYLNTLADYTPPPPKDAGLNPMLVIVVAAALFTLGHALGAK